MRVLPAIFSCLLLALTAGLSPAAADPIRLVALGDSLMAGYGLEPGKGFPAQLEAALARKGYDVNVIDAGVSGDTTAGGLARLDWSVGPDADAVILGLGANDALRGLPPAETRKTLAAILDKLKARDLPVLLAGMLAPPNLGPDFGKDFNAIYPGLAEQYDVALYPFFLDGVAAESSLNLADGMHPNAEGIAVIVDRILPAVEALLRENGLLAPAQAAE